MMPSSMATVPCNVVPTLPPLALVWRLSARLWFLVRSFDHRPEEVPLRAFYGCYAQPMGFAQLILRSRSVSTG